MSSEESRLKALERAVETEPEFLTLANRGVIRPKALPDLMVQKLARQFKRPEPPMITIEKGGKTWQEPNPSDPKYLADIEERKIVLGDAFIDLTMLAGFEIVQLPPGVKPMEKDEEWEEELKAVGIEVPEGRIEKRLLWMRYRIFQQASDLERLRVAVERLGSVDESEIKTAEELF